MKTKPCALVEFHQSDETGDHSRSHGCAQSGHRAPTSFEEIARDYLHEAFPTPVKPEITWFAYPSLALIGLIERACASRLKGSRPHDHEQPPMSRPRFHAIRMMMLSFLLLALASRVGLAQPFGIAEGTPTAQLKVLKEIMPYVYSITPKILHPDFESYSVMSTPEDGVCELLAVGFTLTNDTYGDQARSLFSKISSQLSEKYGNSKLFDFLQVGSIWREPNMWAMSIYKNERVYSRFWNKDEHSILQDGIKEIHLQAKALNPDATTIFLSYTYDNIDRCKAKANSVGAGAL